MSLKGCITAILTAGCIPLSAAAGPAAAQDAPPSAGDKWSPWTELGGYAANHSDARRGELTLWAPLVQDGRSLVFADIRGKLFDDDQREGNAAIGYRFMSDTGWNPGFWIGFDRRRTELDSDFNQISFGVEALSPDWDLRINGYAPLDDSKLVSSATTGSASPTAELSGGTILLVPGLLTQTDRYELAFWGVDAEIGFRIPLEHFAAEQSWATSLKDESVRHAGRRHDLRLFVGGYYFDHPDFDGEVAGPRIRAEWRIDNFIEDWEGSRLTFEAAYQHDDVRDNQVEAGIRLRIPLGGSSRPSRDGLSAQERRMDEGLKRDTDIVARARTQTTTISSGGAPEAVEDAETGVDFDQVIMVENGSDLNTAVTAGGGNALIIAKGGGANFGQVVMQGDQTLLGGGGGIEVRGRTSGATATFTAPGITPTIQSGAGNVVTGANNSHIAGVTIDGSGTATLGISLTTANQNAVITDTTVQNAAGYGILFASTNATLKLQDSVISDSVSGIYIGTDNTTAVIQGNIFRNMTNFGPDIHHHGGPNTVVTLQDNRFEGSFGTSLVNFSDGTSTIAAGSTGNVDASSPSADLCTHFGSFTGSFSFTNGQTINQGGC